MKRARDGGKQTKLSFSTAKATAPPPASEVITIDDSEEEEERAGGAHRPPAPASALAAMMAAAAAPPRRETFSLDCISSAGSTHATFSWSWLNTTGAPLPPPALWSADVKLKLPGERKPVLVCLRSSLPSSATAGAASASSSGCRLSPSALKSCLQKAVRRGLAPEAVRLAGELWRLSPSDAVRRLMIIVIEDATLATSYPILGWLLCATAAGFEPGGPHLAAYLSIVWDAAVCPWEDSFEEDGGGAAATPSAIDSMAARAGQQPLDASAAASSIAAAAAAAVAEAPTPSERNDFLSRASSGAALLRSLAARGAYGGMAGDVRMLAMAGRAWLARLGGTGVTATPPPAMPAPLQAVVPGGPGTWVDVLLRLAPSGAVNPAAACLSSYTFPLHPGRAFAGTRGGSSTGGVVAAPPLGAAAATSLPSLRAVLDTVLRLRRADCPLAGIDFHCSNMLEKLLEENGAGVRQFAAALALHRGADSLSSDSLEDALKRAVWTFRSKLNWRASVDGGTFEELRRSGVRVSPARPARPPASTLFQLASASASASSAAAGAAQLPSTAGAYAAAVEVDPVEAETAAMQAAWRVVERRVDEWAVDFVNYRVAA